VHSPARPGAIERERALGVAERVLEGQHRVEQLDRRSGPARRYVQLDD
jgi:hypothetical protein